jgi:transposase
MYGANDYTLDKHYVLALRFGDFARGDHLVEIFLWVLPVGDLPNNWLALDHVPGTTAKTRSASVPTFTRDRNLIERFFNKIKQCRRIATRYDKLAANYLAFVKLACLRLWLRVYECTA